MRCRNRMGNSDAQASAVIHRGSDASADDRAAVGS